VTIAKINKTKSWLFEHSLALLFFELISNLTTL